MPFVTSAARLPISGKMRVKRLLAAAALVTLSIGCAANRPRTFCVALAGAGTDSDARDPDASGTAVLEFTDATTVQFSVHTKGIGTVIATHVHRGSAGVMGPMAREINPGFEGDSFGGTASGIPPEIVADILKNPSGFYLKLHSLRYPGGAIRGQLLRCKKRPGMGN
jgi:hypothetical protein